jgi:hypothetical protein
MSRLSGTRPLVDRTVNVPLVLPCRWLGRLNAEARRQNVSRSEVIRRAIATAGLLVERSNTTEVTTEVASPQ